MVMTYQLILSPSETTKKMLLRRMGLREEDGKELMRNGSSPWGAVLLVQGGVAEIFAAVDLGTKAAPVTAREVWGNCPQHINTVAFIGAVADIRTCLQALQSGGLVK